MLRRKSTIRFAWQTAILGPIVGLIVSSPVAAIEPGEFDCVIEPHMVVDLSSRVDGIVDTILVDRGDLVEKDQVLVKLDAGVEQAAVDHARARAAATSEIRAGQVSVAFAERRRGRVETLYRDQAVSSDQMDEMATESDLTALQLERAEENNRLAQLELRQALEILKRHTIRSPIRGVVTQRFLSPGESVEDQPILRLAQIDPLRVEVIVPVSLFGKIQVSQRAIVRPEPPKDGEYPAYVKIVDRVADAASGTFRVRLTMPNPDYELPSGLKCRVQFLSGKTQAIVELANAPAATESDSLLTQCRTLGPITTANQAEQLRSTIAPHAVQAKLRKEERSTGERYLILSQRQATLDDAQALAAKMRAAGIDDLLVFERGAHAQRISLGVYRDRQQAEAHVARLHSLGFATDLVAQGTGTRDQFWLDVELAEGVVLAEAVGSLPPDVDTSAVACDSVMAARE